MSKHLLTIEHGNITLSNWRGKKQIKNLSILLLGSNFAKKYNTILFHNYLYVCNVLWHKQTEKQIAFNYLVKTNGAQAR